MRGVKGDMTSSRGVTELFSPTDSLAGAGVSGAAHIGTKPFVALFVSNTSGGPLTFGIQVAGGSARSAGLNEFDSSDLPDGGLVWHTYYSWKDPTTAVTFVVADNGEVAFDLSPFAPEMLRITCSGAFNAGEVLASVTFNGPS